MRLRGAARTVVPLACLALSIPAGADDTPDVAPADAVQATILTLQPGVLALDLQSGGRPSSGDARPLPRDAIVRAEVRTPPDGARRAFVGLAMGIVIGVGVAAVAASVNHGSAFCDTTRATSCELGIGAVLGGVSGFAIGALTTGDERPRARRSPDRDETQTAVGPPSPAVNRR